MIMESLSPSYTLFISKYFMNKLEYDILRLTNELLTFESVSKVIKLKTNVANTNVVVTSSFKKKKKQSRKKKTFSKKKKSIKKNKSKKIAPKKKCFNYKEDGH